MAYKGMCTHFVSGDTVTYIKEELSIIKDLGYNCIRNAFYWNMTNQSPYTYGFYLYQIICEVAEKVGLGVGYTLCYGNNYLYPALVDKKPPIATDPAYMDWLAVYFALFGEKVEFTGFYNEPNRWMTTDEYIKLLYTLRHVMAMFTFNGKLYVGEFANIKGTNKLDKDYIKTILQSDAFKRLIRTYDCRVSYHPYSHSLQELENDYAFFGELLHPGVDTEATYQQVPQTENGLSLANATPEQVKQYHKERLDFADQYGVDYFHYCWNNRQATNSVERGYNQRELLLGKAV